MALPRSLSNGRWRARDRRWGSVTGNQEGYALALDDSSGAVLWKFQTGSGIRSQPITYRIDGRQYVAIGSGTGGLAVSVVGQPKNITMGSALIVFALPK